MNRRQDEESLHAQRRAHARRLLSIPAELVRSGDAVRTHLLDLSRAGAGLVHGAPLQQRDHYVLRFQLPHYADASEVRIEIVYSVPVEGSGQHRCGARFLDLDAETEARLVDFLTSPDA